MISNVSGQIIQLIRLQRATCMSITVLIVSEGGGGGGRSIFTDRDYWYVTSLGEWLTFDQRGCRLEKRPCAASCPALQKEERAAGRGGGHDW